MRQIPVLACAGMMLAGCAGREPAPVSAYLPDDAQLTCQSIDTEIRGNNDAIRTRVNEDAEVQNKNIVVGAAGALLFFPIALAMDFKGAAMTEASAFEQRNRTLAGLAAHNRCDNGASPVTVAEATQEREAAQAAAKAAEMNDVDGVKNPSDQRLRQAPSAPAPVVPPATSQAP